MRKQKIHSSFGRLSAAEKEAIYAECERVRPDEGVPLSAADRRLHRRAGLPVGRPKIGKGAKRINISMERGLLKSADEFAHRKGLSRAGLIAKSVKAYLASAA